jgi:hypothetical protein
LKNSKHTPNVEESSTDDDEEITWTCLQRSHKRTHETFEPKEPDEEKKTPARSELVRSPNAMKPPPRPAHIAASLDRRQRSRSQSHRRERDSKSRSTHSLKEKDLNDKILIANNLSKDNNSSSSCSNRNRMSPIAWEIPPPPAFHPWEQHYHKHNMASREELRTMDYYRRPYDPYRLGSCQELYSHYPSTLSLQGNCDSPYYHYPPPPCCNNHYYPPSYQQQVVDWTTIDILA